MKNLTNVWIVKKYPYLCETNGPLVKWFNTLPFHGRGTGSNPVRTTPVGDSTTY